MPEAGPSSGIGTPDQLREHLRGFEDAGVDQVIFIQQGGRNRHEHICESLELFAEKVLPDFKENEAQRERAKLERLAPYLEAAMGRKQFMPALTDDEIPEIEALGRQVVAQRKAGNEAAGEGTTLAGAEASSVPIPTEDPLGD